VLNIGKNAKLGLPGFSHDPGFGVLKTAGLPGFQKTRVYNNPSEMVIKRGCMEKKTQGELAKSGSPGRVNIELACVVR